MTVRIVSYNLLVSIYAEQEDYYIKCQSKYLQRDYRWNLIQAELEKEILHQENTIVCLQELCLSMLPKLELFFRRLKYTLFSNLYGGAWNDYMGVGVAIPMSMQINEISYVKIGDYIRSICKPRLDTTVDSDDARDNGMNPWDTAMERLNTLICLELVIDNQPLCVGTYHMPCLYKMPDVMIIHSSIVKDLMFQKAAGKNLILAGDFNFEAKDRSYQGITRKGYLENRFPKSNEYIVDYQPKTEQILKSAYQEKNGSEPIYTNFSSTPDSPDFRATLDYIFFAGSLKVESVLELPAQPTGESYPDETHPSDHLMIAATFQLS